MALSAQGTSKKHEPPLRRPFLLLILAAFVPLAALSVALAFAALQAEREKVEHDALERVRLLAADITRDLTAQLDVLRVLTQSREFDNGVTQETFVDLAHRVKQEMPGWMALVLTDPAAQIVTDASLERRAPDAGPPRVVDIESHRQAVETRQPVIGRVLRGQFGRPAVALRAPVIRDGNLRYVLTAVITSQSIRERFLKPGLPAHWLATVLDSAGNIVARNAGTEALIGEPGSAAARAAREGGSEGLYPGLVLEGIATISAFHRLPVGNWSVHVGVPRGVFMAPLRRSLWLIGIGIAATLLMAVSFLWLLLRELRLRRAEEQGRESARRLEALGRMTGGVAHDFNNLLMIVQGGAEGIKRRLSDPEKLRTFADAILAAVQRGQALTRQLLAFAQRGKHEPVSFRLQDRAAELKELITRSVRENVELKLSIPANTWPVRADPNALEVALINLAVNASDAMPSGGPLAISAMNIILQQGREGNPGLDGPFVAISVKDKGIGIGPDDIDRIFEPFFTTKGQGKGTGLGLSQVYGFAQQSGGTITVQGKLGEGTTFTLFLPRTVDVAVTPEPKARAPLGRNQGRVLLVEDNKDVAEMTATMLGDAGYDVTKVASASAAQQLLKTRRDFDVLLSDIVMDEGISGLDLARGVRLALPELPIVLMTGFSEALKGAEFVELPVVFKPFSQEEMLEALREVRRQSRVPA